MQSIWWNLRLNVFPLIYIDEMKALGIDDVYCLSVNDAFVMRQVFFWLLYTHVPS